MAAEDGYRRSQYVVANCYADGRGVTKDRAKAVGIHKELAKAGYIKSMLFVGESYYLGEGVEQDRAASYEWFRMGADEGDVFCEYYVGDCYEHGYGVECSADEAIKWYRKAAAQGHTLSMKLLEAVEKYGGAGADEGVSPFDSFLAKAEAGDPQSMFIIGRYYEDGIGMNNNMAMAREWYSRAAERGNEAAKRALVGLDAGKETA